MHESRGGVVYDSASLKVTAVRVPHGDWEYAFAFVIEVPGRKVVLSGDARVNEALSTASQNADVLVHEVYPEVRLKPEDRPGGAEWPRYMQSVHTSDVEVGRIANAARVRHVVLTHVVWMGGSVDELLAGVKRGGYNGRVTVARDLDVY